MYEENLNKIKDLLSSPMTDQFIFQYRHFLKDMKINDHYFIGEKIKAKNIDFPAFKKIKIAVLSNFTSQSIENYIRALALKNGIIVDFYISKSNQILTEVLELEGELYSFTPDLIFILIDEQIVVENMPESWLASTHLNGAVEEAKNYLEKILKNLEKLNSCLVVTNTIPISENLLNNVVDYRSKALVSLYFSELNTWILKKTLENRQVITIDISIILQNENVKNLNDERLSIYANMRFHESLLYKLADEFTKIVNAKLGFTKKCLVVDLDNTLWGGIIGDDGVEGIELGGAYEGQAYQKFQSTIKKLKSQGVLLAINSKNDLKNITEVFTQHSEMHLHLEDFVCIKANWNPKNENMREIAQELNIGTDSFVFVDDSQAECELIRKYLPEVTTIHLQEDPSFYVSQLIKEGLFNKLEMTDEDFLRTEIYRSDNKRRESSKTFKNIEDYLFDLNIRLRIFIPNKTEILRISQITLRTNQFNLTGERYSSQEVETLLNNNSWIVLGIETEDRFGKNGIVGAVFLEMDSNILKIKNFLLSCRVFSRDIETAVLRKIIHFAKVKQFKYLLAEYIQTQKNSLVQDFYIKNEFLEEMADGKNALYKHNLDHFNEIPSWIHITSCALEN